jgi:hypothetical protein
MPLRVPQDKAFPVCSLTIDAPSIARRVQIDPLGKQHLVWLTELSRIETDFIYPAYDIVWTAAKTGNSEVVATG